MKEQLKVLEALDTSLCKPFDDNPDQLTISEYPELAKLSLSASMMQRFTNNPTMFKKHLNVALKWAREILSPTLQTSYAFTSSSWYTAARCHQTIASMLLTLRAIEMELNQPPSSASAIKVIEQESKDNGNDSPRPSLYA